MKSTRTVFVVSLLIGVSASIASAQQKEKPDLYPQVVNPLLSRVQVPRLVATVTELSTKYPGRHYNAGRDSMLWLREQFVAASAGRTDVTVELFEHRFVQPSIIAKIHGSSGDPKRVLILGAHGDSVTGSPGADDNA